MVTRRVNGGLNGYADRLRWYDEGALKLLGFTTVAAFQKSAGLVVDGISGPKTRAALHKALTGLKVNAAQAANEPATAQVAAPALPAARNPVSPPPAATAAALVAAGAALWHWGAGLWDAITFWN